MFFVARAVKAADTGTNGTVLGGMEQESGCGNSVFIFFGRIIREEEGPVVGNIEIWRLIKFCKINWGHIITGLSSGNYREGYRYKYASKRNGFVAHEHVCTNRSLIYFALVPLFFVRKLCIYVIIQQGYAANMSAGCIKMVLFGSRPPLAQEGLVTLILNGPAKGVP